MWAVELRRGESRRALEDLIRPTQLAVLPLKLGQSGPLVGRQTRRVAGVDASLLHPVPQRVRHDPQLLTDPPAGGVDTQLLRPVDQVEREADRPLTQLVGVLPR